MKRILPFLKEYKLVVVTLLVVGIIGDISLIQFKSDLITFAILGLVVFFFRFYKFTTKRIFVLCLIPILIMFFMFLIDSRSIVVEKASVWLFLLLGTGIMWELFKKDTK